MGRFRGIAGALLSITVVTTALLVAYFFLRTSLTHGEWLVLLGGVLFPVVGALYIRETGNITQGLVLTNLAGIAVVVGWAVMSGGILSVALPWLIANLGLICTFGSIAIQTAIGGTVLVVLVALYALTRHGMLPPSLMGADVMPEMAALALISSATLMVGAALVIAAERKRTKLRLRAALERAEVANRTKSTFLSSMSHEFRTPLAAVMGFAEVLREDAANPLNGLQQEHVTRILTAAEHLSALVNQLLEMARLEAGEIDIRPTQVNLAELLRSASAMMSLDARAMAIILDTDLPAEPLMIEANETRLRQVLINLISNAIRFNRPSGTVTVRASAAGQRVRIEVVDTGRGIPAANQGEVFVAFSRMGAESSHIEGSGLGLAISKRLVELMNGTMGFDSEEGRGSTFWLELPRTRPD